MRTRLGIIIVGVALSVAGAATAAQAVSVFGFNTPVAVTPARGTPRTTFTVRFNTPMATGSTHGLRTWEIVSVADRGQHQASCTSETDSRPPSAAAHARVSVTFPVAAKNWCTGTYAGTVTLYRSIICDPGPALRQAACPEIEFAPEPVGHFRFTVAFATS